MFYAAAVIRGGIGLTSIHLSEVGTVSLVLSKPLEFHCTEETTSCH
jgi:hypothetical protein